MPPSELNRTGWNSPNRRIRGPARIRGLLSPPAEPGGDFFSTSVILPRVNSRYWGVILVLTCLVWDAHVPQAAPSSSRLVVSYLVSPEPDSIAGDPGEGNPTNIQPAHAWDWRIYDPLTKRDTLFLKLRFFPMNLRWDSLYTIAEFVYGNKIARVRWAMGAQIQELAQVPTDSCLCDFWHDALGGLHLVAQREAPATYEGRPYIANVGTRWDYEQSRGAWRVTEVDSGAGGHYGECYVTAKLRRGAAQVFSWPVAALLDSMGLDLRRARTLSQDTHGNYQADSWLWVPSVVDTTQGLEMGEGEGDFVHAFSPVLWVDRRTNRRRTIYPVQWPTAAASGNQVCFMERVGMVLVAGEFDGANPVVADMKTGRTLLKITQNSARAVWVPAPR